MAKINIGRINERGDYEKIVNFSKAVLWKDKQLSIPVNIFHSLLLNNVQRLNYIDRKKGEMWIFKMKDVMSAGVKKAVGQEPQWYFPIEMATKMKIK